jgi:hypothetical protein
MQPQDDDPASAPDEDLPILDWEDASRRALLPTDLCAALDLPVFTLRWSAEKFAQVMRSHARDAAVIIDIEQRLQQWELAGPDDTREGNWNVLFFAGGRMHIFTFGIDASGSYNVVTIFGTTRQPYITRKMHQPEMRRRVRK